MAEFSNRDEVKRWLDAIEPAERRREVAVALAARAALRVLPLLGRELRFRLLRPDEILSARVLPCLRATGTAWVGARYPAHSNELRAYAAAAAFAAAGARAVDAAANDAAYADARAAGAIANTDDYLAVDIAADAIAIAISATDKAAATVAHMAINATADALAADSVQVDSGRSGAELAGMLLWPIGAPVWATENWQTLKSALLAADRGWEVWTDWYEGRLAGDAAHPPIEALEVARATIADEIWKQGPAAVNAEIKRLIDEHERGELVVDDPRASIATADDRDQDKAAFAPILATRAALRALPLLVIHESRLNGVTRLQDVVTVKGRTKSLHVLAAFRALAIAWSRVRYPDAVNRQWCVAAGRQVGVSGWRSELERHLAKSAAGAAFSAGSETRGAAAAQATSARIEAQHAIGIASDRAAQVAADLANSADDRDVAVDISPRRFTELALWVGRNPPAFLQERWNALKKSLTAANEGWEVWIDWYETRLDGRVHAREVELAYVEFIRNVVDSAPARVANAEIRRLIDLQSQKPSVDLPPSKQPEIPRQKPAAVEPIFKGSRLTLAKKTAEADMPGPTISAALKALAQTLGELAEDAAEQTNIDRRFVARLQEIAKGVPKKRPNQTDLFRLGHDYDELSAYSKTVADSWPELVAARYMAMTCAFERTLRRFPRWLDFTRELPIAKISAQDARDISQAAQTLSAVLRAPENLDIVNPVLPDALDRISAPLDLAAQRHEARADPIELGMELLARDVLESVNNTFKLVAELALAAKLHTANGAEFAGKKLGSYATQFGRHADQSLLKSSAQLGDKVGPAIVKLAKWSVRATIGGAVLQSQGPTLAAWLVQHYPQMFSWLEPFATFLH